MLHRVHAVFIDRDGTIGGSDQVEYPGQMTFYPGVKESIQLLKQHGVRIFSFTNQPGVARGEVEEKDFVTELSVIGFDQVYLCPHEHNAGCTCRKPSIGMLEKAVNEYHIDLHKSIVIGDRWTDLMAAQEAGCKKILVRTGAGEVALTKYHNNEYYGKWGEVSPDFIAKDFVEAVHWIIQNG
ncbi:HAD-IIIA family hydrolase [Bacillus carboniphilus]|uniref:D,D-heptose 1,7-bisphosphate phosphatase n=1 Tax=Bacillus carboniphilus TaxID=86663 RepID=A0ABP3GH21_9BACI